MRIVGWVLVVLGGIGIPGNLSSAISGEGYRLNPDGSFEREPNTAKTRGMAVGGLAACAASIGVGVWMIQGGAYKK